MGATHADSHELFKSLLSKNIPLFHLIALNVISECEHGGDCVCVIRANWFLIYATDRVAVAAERHWLQTGCRIVYGCKIVKLFQATTATNKQTNRQVVALFMAATASSFFKQQLQQTNKKQTDSLSLFLWLQQCQAFLRPNRNKQDHSRLLSALFDSIEPFLSQQSSRWPTQGWILMALQLSGMRV